jgi:hypothetical protein
LTITTVVDPADAGATATAVAASVPDTASSPAATVIRMRVSLIRCSFQQGLDPLVTC